MRCSQHAGSRNSLQASRMPQSSGIKSAGTHLPGEAQTPGQNICPRADIKRLVQQAAAWLPCKTKQAAVTAAG